VTRQPEMAVRSAALEGRSSFEARFARAFGISANALVPEMAETGFRPYALMLFSRTTWPQMLTCLAKNA
jgi:hypothetical protein